MKAEPRESYDVVVIGAGRAGFNARSPPSVPAPLPLLLEKNSFSGGNSMLAAGGYNAVGTKQQKAKGITDTVEAYVEDTLKGGRGRTTEPSLKSSRRKVPQASEMARGHGRRTSQK